MSKINDKDRERYNAMTGEEQLKYIHRLEEAIKNAHKAMQLLKQDIADIRSENEDLKLKLAVADIDSDTSDDDRTSNVGESSNEPPETCAASSAANFDLVHVEKERGWSVLAELSGLKADPRDKSPNAKKSLDSIRRLLVHATADHYHLCAQYLATYPPRTLAKGFLDTITQLAETAARSKSRASTTDLDLLVSVLVSMATLAPSGLLVFEVVWLVLKNALFADLRSLSPAPLHSLLTGQLATSQAVCQFDLQTELTDCEAEEGDETVHEQEEAEVEDNGPEAADREPVEVAEEDQGDNQPTFRDAEEDYEGGNGVSEVGQGPEAAGTLIALERKTHDVDLERLRAVQILSSRLHVVVSACLRLGNKAGAVQVLHELSLCPMHYSQCEGIAEGLLSLLGTGSFKRLVGASSLAAVSMCAVAAGFPSAERVDGNPVKVLLSEVPRVVIGDNWSSLKDSECVIAMRRVGFWQSIERLAIASLPTAQSMFDVLGFTGLADQAKGVLALLKVADASAANIRATRCADVVLSPSFECVHIRTGVAVSVDEEAQALEIFGLHWQESLDRTTDFSVCLRAFQLLSNLAASITGEFDSSNFGWKTGVAGFGIGIRERLKNRIDIGTQLVKKSPELAQVFSAWRVDAEDAQPRVKWLKLSSVEEGEFLKGVEFADRCLGCLCAAEQPERASDVLAIVGEMVSLIALAAVERLLFLACCSARAFLRVVRDSHEKLSCMDHVLDSLRQCSRFLSAMPPPFGGTVRCDVVRALLSAQSAWTPANTVVPSCYSSELSRRLPVFVINLDRRVDRWKRFLASCEVSSLLAIRVTAVDGKLVRAQQTSSSSSSSSAGDKGIDIPESDVTFVWDSTENSFFDAGCLSSAETPMSGSERACAASHLSVWRAIAALDSESVESAGAGINMADVRLCFGLKSVRSGLSGKKGQRRALGSDFFVIFEDDSRITPALQTTFHSKVSEIMASAPADADVVYLGGAIPRGAAKFTCKPYAGGKFLRVNYVWMLHAYILRRRAVEVLLSNLPINSPVDNFVASLIYHGQLTGYLLGKKIVTQVGHSLKHRLVDSNIQHSGRLKRFERAIHADAKRQRVK